MAFEFSATGVKEKSYKNCPFKVTLPQILVMDGVIELSFRAQAKVGVSVDISLSETYLTDKLNRKYDNHYTGEAKPKERNGKNFNILIPIHNKQFLLSDSVLILRFLAGDHRKYEIGYIYKRGTGYALDYIIRNNLNNEEIHQLEDSVRQANSKEKTEKESGKLSNSQLDGSISNADGQILQVPQVEEYKKALLREKFFLQKEGGRRYKLTNGILLNHKNGLSTYSFEMEAELNLTDDAPITLYVGVNEATGSVLVCEGFQIIVIIDKDFGNKIGQAMLGVEPWKLLEALVKKLEKITTSHRMAMKLINEGPGLAIADSAMSIRKGQQAAIDAAGQNEITVIWGPPGTGKTYTMAQIAKEGLQHNKSILIVSHSNVSVDGMVKQTVASLRSADMGNLLTEGKVLRYGYVRDEELSRDSYAVAYNYVLNNRPDLKQQLDLLYRVKDQLKKSGNYLTDRGEQIEKELKKTRAEIRSEERRYVSKAKLVATTISKVTVDPLFDEVGYDIVMFDEVSMAYVPQIICAACYAKERLVLVGDFRQLAPIVQSEAKTVLGKDIFAYLGIYKGRTVCSHPWLVMLNEQRRMHPAISAFPSANIYNHLLKDHISVKESRAGIVKKQPLPGHAINLINLAGSYCATMKNSDNSRFNILSAIISFSTALMAEENGEKSIGIITPYAAQTRLIRAMIQDHRKNDKTEVACSTVHQFQGSERDMIIFDAVESYPASKVGWLMGKEFDSVSRLINVAVTRARGKLITIANAAFWENKFGGTQHVFYRLVRYLAENGNVISVKEKKLNTYIQRLPSTQNLCLYIHMEDVIDDLKLDVGKAKEKIVISIPDGILEEELQSLILSIIMKASQKGVRVLCKTNGYEDLPTPWKAITWASENTIFPLIVIDDKVAWYGIPKSRGMFKDGTHGYKTVCQTVYRIKGEHTIEMIKTFSDLEYRIVNNQRYPLLEKKESTIRQGNTTGLLKDDGKGNAGLDSFVRKIEKCPKCKKPMTVTRSKNGKVFLKCSSSSCKEIAYLTPELTNWYINKEHVTCPIHHCGIYAALGKYGIYVRCDQGHFLKPDEI